jgi:transglutaminase-like putative cysteine protease
MPGIYKLFTAIVAIIGNVSLISTGEMNPAFSIIGASLLYGYYRSLRGYSQLSKHAVGALSFTTFIVFLINFYINKDIFVSVAQMTLIFQAIKSFDIKEPWDPLQVFFVSLLQLLMASELTNSIYFGIIFVLFVVFIVVSILLGHFVSEGQRRFRPFLKPMASITILTIVLTIIFFVSIPRFRSGLWGRSLSRGIKTTGFSERVDFGSFGRIKLDETIVMRMVIRPDAEGPHYLRGMTFDYFDGMAWYDTLKDSRRIFKRPEDFNIDVPADIKKYEVEVYLEPLDSDVIFTFKKPYRIESEGFFLRKDSAGSFYMKQKVSKRFFYRLFSVDGYYNDNIYLRAYLQTPPGIERIKRLAEKVTANSEDPIKKAEVIRVFLLKNYEYSLFTRRPPEDVTQLEDFLFYSKKGYCEHFATAMTLMLRSIGIPARLVTGFLSGQRNDIGDYYLIRQSDAHSWVEAFINRRWLVFDPTPPVFISHRAGIFLFFDMIRLKWNRYVVGFSTYDQVRMANYIFNYPKIRLKLSRSSLSWIMLIVTILIILFIIVDNLKRKGFSYIRYKGVSAEYVRFMRMISRYGGRIYPSSGTEEVLMEAIRIERFDNEDIKRFIEAYRFLRFSGEKDETMLKNFYERARRLRRNRR